MCGSINDHSVNFKNTYSPIDHGWYTDHSYTYPLKNKQPLKCLIIICIDALLEEDNLDMLCEGIKISIS